MVKYTQTIHRRIADELPTNCLSVFDHFMGLALKDLKHCFCIHDISGTKNIKVVCKYLVYREVRKQ